jgi:sulfatase maturation enzyme AslB (radical SAM superfamily)
MERVMGSMMISKKLIPVKFIPKITQIYRSIDFFNALLSKTLRKRYLTVRIDTVNSCNMKCQYCYTLGLPTSKMATMSVEQFKKIADELFPIARYAYLSCAWEPTMNKNFHEIIKISGHYNVPFLAFVTNGAILTDEIIDAAISTPIQEIQISIDAAEEIKFNDITQSNLFNRVIESMEKLNEKKNLANSIWPKVTINCVVFRGNADQPALLINKYQHLFDKICISGLHIRRRNNLDNYDRLLPQELRNIYLQCNDIADKSTTVDVGMRCEKLLPMLCGLPMRYVLINSSGDLSLCNKQNVGNIIVDSYRDIVHNNKSLFRNLTRVGTPFCKNECDMY